MVVTTRNSAASTTRARHRSGPGTSASEPAALGPTRRRLRAGPGRPPRIVGAGGAGDADIGNVEVVPGSTGCGLERREPFVDPLHRPLRLLGCVAEDPLRHQGELLVTPVLVDPRPRLVDVAVVR